MSNTSRSIQRVCPQPRRLTARPVLLCPSRSFNTSRCRFAEAVTAQAPPDIDPATLDPNTVYTKGQERLLAEHKKLLPIGSRRRRALVAQHPDNTPFDQLPYSCFQEARKVLAADREQKLHKIEEMRKRIAKAQETPAAQLGGEYAKKGKVVRMQKYLEELKILADINDPMVKKRFEDGTGDMNRPIYRYLADKKWREYKRPLLIQRISQFHVVPDFVDRIDPTVEVALGFGKRNVQPGQIVDSHISEQPARLMVQPFDKGERLITIAVIDPDVPDLDSDSFKSRCHFLAINIPISPTKTSVDFSKLDESAQIIQPWLPPFAQKGSPYHRLVIFVLKQEQESPLDPATLQDKFKERDRWDLRVFRKETRLHPVGVNLFRTIWDQDSDAIALRTEAPEAQVELVRKKPEKLPYKKKDGSRYR